MGGKTKSKILSILVVVSMLIGMFSGLEVFADGTTGQVEVTFREATEENLEGCIWADVRFYNASCNVLGTKFTYDPDKLDFWDTEYDVAADPEYFADILNMPDKYKKEGRDESGCWDVTKGTQLDAKSKFATIELSKNISSKIKLNTADESATINSGTGFIDFNDRGYLAYSICMKLKEENATISDLNEGVIKFYQSDTGKYDERNLGAKAQKGEEGAELISATICYPKTVTFLDGENGYAVEEGLKQVSVDVTNTYDEGTNTTTQATFYNTLSTNDIPKDPTSDTKTFAGWCYTDSEKGEQKFVAEAGEGTEAATEIKDNMTVYAKWNCTLSFDLLGGKLSADAEDGEQSTELTQIEPKSIAEGSNIWEAIQGSIGQSTLSKAGYETFINAAENWQVRTGESGSYSYEDITENTTISAHTTVVPKWEARSNTITFHSNFGDDTTTTQNINTDDATNLTQNTFIRPGYSFSGWNVSADSDAVVYSDGDSVTITYDENGRASLTDLYAVWTAEEQTLKFDLNVDESAKYQPTCEGLADSYQVPTDTELSKIDQIGNEENKLKPTRNGYTFVGWYTDENCANPVNDNTKMPITGESTGYEKGYTLYAKWEEAPQTAKFKWNNAAAQGGDESISILTEKSILSALEATEGGPTLATVDGYKVNGWAREALEDDDLAGKETYTIGEEENQKTLVKLTAEDLMPYVAENSTYTIYALWKAEDYQKIKENIEAILKNLEVESDQLVVAGTVNGQFINKENYMGEANKVNYNSAVEALLLYDKLPEEDKANLTEAQKTALDELKKTITEVNHTYIDADGNSITVTEEGLPWNVVVEGRTFNVTNADGEGYNSGLYSTINSAMGEGNSLSGSEAIALVTGITLKELSLKEGTTSNEIVSNDYTEEIQGATITITLNKDNADKYKDYQGFTVSSSESDGTTSYTLGGTVYKEDTITAENVTDEDGTVIGEEVIFTVTGALPEIIGLVANLDQFTVTFDLNTTLNGAAFNTTENIYEIDTEQTKFNENVAKLNADGSPVIAEENKPIKTTLTCQAGEKITTLNRTAIKNPKGRMFKCWNTQQDGNGENIKSGAEYTPTSSTTLYAKWTIPGDCYGTGNKVDGDDLSVILEYYDQFGNNLSADFNNSGKVDGDDLSIVLEYYNKKLENGEIISAS